MQRRPMNQTESEDLFWFGLCLTLVFVLGTRFEFAHFDWPPFFTLVLR